MRRRQWSERANASFARLESLISPDTIIIGGGLSKDYAKFIGRPRTSAEALPAELFNDAGIGGAAVAALDAEDRANA
jgi:polyphosphate glucokinase